MFLLRKSTRPTAESKSSGAWPRAVTQEVGRAVETKAYVTGNIPRFMTNSSLPSQIAVDVPSFLKWMVKRSSRPADGLTPASQQ